MYKLTISLVLYNTCNDELERLLTSLDNQKDINFKLLVLDNSNHSRTLKTYGFEMEYTKSFRNLGFGKGHNENFKKSDPNSFFLVINPDVYFDDPLLLKKLTARAIESGPLSLSSVQILNTNGSDQNVHRLLPHFTDMCRRFVLNKLGVYSPYKHTYTLSHIDKTKKYKCPSISGCFMLFSPGLYSLTGGFDEGLFLYFEDVDLSRRCYLATNGNNFVHGDLSVFHTWKRQGYKNFEMFKVHVLSAVYYFQKYGIFRDNYSKTVNQEFEKLIHK